MFGNPYIFLMDRFLYQFSTGYESVHYGISNIEREHRDSQTPKFGVNQASFDWDTAIQKRQNEKMYGKPDVVAGTHTFLYKFCDFQMAVSCLLRRLFTPNLGIL